MSPRRALPIALCLLLAPAFAGCMRAPVGDAEAAHSGQECRMGSVVVGFNDDGSPVCEPDRARGFACPDGLLVYAFAEDGTPRCRAPGWTATPTREPTEEVASGLKLAGAYGVRNDTVSGLCELKVHVTLSAGAPPLDVGRLIVRYSDGVHVRVYEAAADGENASTAFRPTWIRGTGTDRTMQAGDLVELAFFLVDHELGTRSDAEIQLIPETGTPVPIGLRTPATYSTDTTIALA